MIGREDQWHEHVQRFLRAHRERLAPALREEYDHLLERHRMLNDDASSFFRPQGQPLVAFPIWVADAVGSPRVSDEAVADIVESSVMGYLYVRVHDDLLDEGVGHPTPAMLLADSCLIRHHHLLARHVSSTRFWEFYENVAAAYSAAVLLERDVVRPDSPYTDDDFESVLAQSEPLVLPGAALLELAGEWERLPALIAFVHHAVRAGQIVNDIVDCADDVAHGNYTWVARRLGAVEEPTEWRSNLLFGGIDDLADIVLSDLERASRSADDAGIDGAVEWLELRRTDVLELRHRIVMSVFSS